MKVDAALWRVCTDGQFLRANAHQGGRLVGFADLNSRFLPTECRKHPAKFTEVIDGGPSMGGDVLL